MIFMIFDYLQKIVVSVLSHLHGTFDDFHKISVSVCYYLELEQSLPDFNSKFYFYKWQH